MGTVNFEHELENDMGEVLMTLSVEVSYHVESENYGEDADGNRGERRTYVEIDEVNITNEKGQNVTSILGDAEYDCIRDAAYDAAVKEEFPRRRFL